MNELYHGLKSLVSDSSDPFVVLYAADNLMKGVPPQSKYYAQMLEYRNDLLKMLMYTTWNPNRGLGDRPLNPIQAKIALKQLAQQNVQAALRQQEMLQKALLEAEFKAFMQQQFELMQKQMQEAAKEQAKQNEMIRGLLRQLTKEEDVVVANKLLDPEPMQRWIAVLVADRKRLPVQEKLIDLLDDPHPAVRQAAHSALVRLSRSTDFGPAPKKEVATSKAKAKEIAAAQAKEIASAQKQWREWHQLQVDTRFAADQTPGRAR